MKCDVVLVMVYLSQLGGLLVSTTLLQPNHVPDNMASFVEDGVLIGLCDHKFSSAYRYGTSWSWQDPGPLAQ